MFDKLLGGMTEKQEEMKARLADELVEATVDDGAIKVVASANRQIKDIIIDTEKVDMTDTEHVQDLLVVAINEVLEIAAEREASEAKNMISDMIPSGLGGLFGMNKEE